MKKFPYHCQVAFCVVVLSVFCSVSNASGVSPYLPLNTSPILEHEIERLAVVANIPDLTKPYSIATIFQALDNIRSSYPLLYRRVNTSLEPYTSNLAITHGAIRVSDAGVETAVETHSRGESTQSRYSVSAQAQWQIYDNVALYLGAQLSENIDQASGSIFSLGFNWAQLDIGYKDYWLSPFQGSAQLLSTQAQTMPSISLSNNTPLNFFKKVFNYEVFVAQISEQGVRFDGDNFTYGSKPLLCGVHLCFQPTEGWTLGATRMFQFGGGERTVSLGTLGRAFYDPRGTDNDAQLSEQSGNQIASISSKMNFQGAVPFSFSVELAGEDTSNNKNYQLGNTAVTTGIFFPYFFSRNLSLTYEYSQWQAGWYVNSIYEDGYVNEGVVLGHWAMQTQREGNTSVGGTSHFLRSQWQTSFDHIVDVSLRAAEHDSKNYKEQVELELSYTFPWRDNFVSFEAYLGKNGQGESFWQLGGRYQWR